MNAPWWTASAQSGGSGNVRVVDASTFPEVPSTATNLTTIMAAEYIFKRAFDR